MVGVFNYYIQSLIFEDIKNMYKDGIALVCDSYEITRPAKATRRILIKGVSDYTTSHIDFLFVEKDNRLLREDIKRWVYKINHIMNDYIVNGIKDRASLRQIKTALTERLDDIDLANLQKRRVFDND